MNEESKQFRFQVALSFPGEHRARVEKIAQVLRATLGQEKILYDKWHRAEFARPNLDLYLPKLYREQSNLLVFFHCGEYVNKEWCGLEWRVGRDLLKQKEDDRLMLLKLDDAAVPGLMSIDGSLDIRAMSDDDVAGEILKRLGGPALDIDQMVRDLRAQTLADIHDHCGTIRILNMEKPVELGSVYTDVNILEKRSANLRKTRDQLIAESGLDTFDRFGILGERTERLPGLEAFDKHQRIMIYGKPGAGKTTFLKRLAMECANGHYRAELVPVFVTLRDFADTHGSPSLFQYIERPHPVLARGRALILLDGLDEVRDRDFNRVRKAIDAFTTEFHRCPMALTCRIAAREYAFERFTEVELADFGAHQIDTFANGWFGVQHQGKKAAAFLEKLKANKPVFELASSPLLLTLLCLVFQERGDFGDSRAELYWEGLDILLRKWDSKRDIERDRPYGLSVTVMEDLLSEIAYRRFLISEHFFDQGSLEEQIGTFFAERNLLKPGEELLAKKVLNSIESSLGLLVNRASRVYSFSHLTFQEYLTAKRLSKKLSLLGDIGSKVGDRRWREVWLLIVTMVDADDIILELKNLIDKLVEKDPEIQKYMEWCHRKAAAQRGGYKPPALRAFYMALHSAVALPVARDLAVALAYALDLAHAPALDLDLVIALDLARASASDLDRAVRNAVAVAPAMVGELQLLRAQIPDHPDRTWWLTIYPAWREKLRAVAIHHRDIGHDWKFTDKQMKLLNDYYNANLLLVECMQAARGLTNKTRQDIEDTMLLPYDQIPPRP